MGYYTHYTLTYDNEPVEKIEEAKKTFNGGYDPFESGETKWYEHEDEMKKLSEQFPKIVFALKGTGESNEDMWYKYFKNGKMQVCRAKVSFDPYNPRKLK